MRQHFRKSAKEINELEGVGVSVASGIFQLSCYLIAISANAGCMDLGFIVGGQRTLVKQGNLYLYFIYQPARRTITSAHLG